MTATDRASAAFGAHERFVWGLAYRMTGSAADADDVVQETFARFAKHRPSEDLDLRPWLVRVAVNLSRDVLRRRVRDGYTGPWLPSPVDDDELGEPDAAPQASHVYERREGAAYAFLVALETLSPAQRAVLLLRDVFDYSVAEVAAALRMSESHVKVTHHRARKKLAHGGDVAARPGRERVQASRAAIERFLIALASEDSARIEACLAEGIRATSDGAGEFIAALKPVRGRQRVTRFLLGVQRKFRPKGVFELRSLNGEPALVADFESTVPGAAPRWVMRCELDAEGQVTELHIVLATRKLTHVRRVGEPTGKPALDNR